MKTSLFIVAALLSVSIHASANAAYGDVDPSFTSFIGGCDAIATREDGGAYVNAPVAAGIVVTRLTAQGTPDTSWGAGGRFTYPAAQFTRVLQLLRGKDGDLFVVDVNFSARTGGISRVLADGTLDPSFGIAGRVSTPTIVSAALQDDGKIAILVSEGSSATFMRFTARGQPDPAFGHGGALYVPNLVHSSESIYGWAISSEGNPEIGTYSLLAEARPAAPKLVVAHGDFTVTAADGGRVVPQGVATWMSPEAKVDPTGGLAILGLYGLTRFRADGSLDEGFGAGGWTTIGGIYTPIALWRESDGSWTVAGIGEENYGWSYIGDNYLRAVRFDANGARDTSFGFKQFGGVKGSPFYSKMIARASDGSVLFADDSCNLHRHLTGSPRAEGTIVEYYHPVLDHYFMTSSPNEIAGLDSNPLGWERTGQTFGDWTPSNLPGAVHVCRFYGDPVIGPNSHFYTGEDFECQGLINLDAATRRGSPAWHLEAKPFDIAIPSNGACPANLQPVYRAFNGPAAGSYGPNHRYTTDPAVYTAMLAKGWLPEGVHLCAPPRSN